MNLARIFDRIQRIIPQTYRSDRLLFRSLIAWILVGLLVRLIFMPISLHEDLLSTYHRSYLILEGASNISLYRPSQLIQSLFLFIYRFLLPLEELIGSNYSHVAFANHYLSYRALFLFKIPYIIFDFSSAIIFLHLFKEREKGFLAFRFWMINPVGIFAFYIFSRYEAITIFFIMLSLFFAKINRPYFSVFSIAIGVFDRVYPLLFLPFFIFFLGKNTKKRVILSLIGVAPFLLRELFKFNIDSPISSLTLSGNTFFTTRFVDFFLSLRFDLTHGTIYFFIASSVFLILYYIYFEEKEFDSLWEFPLLILLLFYATSYFHPQYFAWFTPFIALAISKYRGFLTLHILQILCFIVYIFQFGKATFGWLFAPIDPSFFINLMSPREFIDKFYSSIEIINYFRSALSGISFFMIWLVFYKKIKSLGQI